MLTLRHTDPSPAQTLTAKKPLDPSLVLLRPTLPQVILWGLDNMKERGQLIGHTLGVRSMSYANGVMVTVGFEYDGIAWDLTSKTQFLVLRGHRYASARRRARAVATVKCVISLPPPLHTDAP